MGYLRTGTMPLTLAGLALVGALLMQVITNLQNDIGFTTRGAEGVGQRTGLPRATAKGWLGLRVVQLAIRLLCALALALGLLLMIWRGWPVLAMGSASLLAALAYMGGPRPIAYTPLGELTVFVFFGLVAVMGTDWLLTDGVGLVSLLAAIAIGSLSAAALAVNNHRDMAHDRLLGRHTFAVMWGPSASQKLMGLLLITPFAMVGLMTLRGWPLLLPLALVPAAISLYRDFRQCTPGLAYNAILFRVFRLELWFASLLSVGAVVTRYWAG